LTPGRAPGLSKKNSAYIYGTLKNKYLDLFDQFISMAEREIDSIWYGLSYLVIIIIIINVIYMAQIRRMRQMRHVDCYRRYSLMVFFCVQIVFIVYLYKFVNVSKFAIIIG